MGRYPCSEATDRTQLGGLVAKVLFYDIETAPNLAYVWGHYDQNVVKQYRMVFALFLLQVGRPEDYESCFVN